MAKLFLVGIGGTGARVIKSFTMMLAAGVSSRYAYEIVPILIDPHAENKDLQRTERLLEKYEVIKNKIDDNAGFFKMKIHRLYTLGERLGVQANTYRFELNNMDKPFRHYIGYNSLSHDDQLMSGFLFSGKSMDHRGDQIDLLDLNMNIGFVGNPHVGSVVLNQFKDSEEYKLLAENFGEEDRIVIISSIFGGTGAAGFPILLKNLREGNSSNNKALLKNGKIAAITVLPYFKVMEEEGSPIRQSDFIAKTKSALMYYKDNITGQNQLNAMYYVGDDRSTIPIANDPGHKGQQNNAHFIELVAALGIFDFMDIPDEKLQCDNGRALSPVYKHFGIRSDEQSVEFIHLDKDSTQRIFNPLLAFVLMDKYLKEERKKSVDSQVWSAENTGNHKLDSDFFEYKHTFYSDVRDFLDYYCEWLEELADNDRAFKPFELTKQTSLANVVKGQTARKKGRLFGWSDITYDDFNEQLNLVSKKSSYVSQEHKFMKIFHVATNELIEKYYKLNSNN